jgi:hypothetical protein
MSEFTHLAEPLRAEVELPVEERLARARYPKWIGYTRAQELLQMMQELLHHPRIHRMPNLLIVGETNNGKTVIVNRFQQLHRATDNQTGEGANVPVLVIQAPPVPEENRFYHAIFDSLNWQYRPWGSAASKLPQVLNLLRAVHVKILIIDEIHHLLAGHINKQRQFLNVLKYIGNELQIALVGVGIKDAIRAIQTDPQMANRFEPAALPRWELDREFRSLLASFERMLPLKFPSNLPGQALATHLLALSEGTIGELSSLLVASTIEAIRTGKERIDLSLLQELEWIPPSEQKRHVERLVS